ncbi:type I secretion system permease/ATPase [Hoeflea sp.]|uniref:type I secretion system permease/ATPase n=1 Tax=Hoeflea sp. TaxID=1940281 RepID=UPI003B013072
MRDSLLFVGVFSFAINLLMLTGPLFMLQVYDRVLTSRSIPTLVTLFAAVVILYGFLGLFDFVRARVLSRCGYRLDVELMSAAQSAWIRSGTQPGTETVRPVADLSAIRRFLCSNGLPALFDLPWVPIYLAIVYLLHVWLGVLATLGALAVVAATLINERITRNPIARSATADVRDTNFSEAANRDAEAIVAMGMVDNVGRYWRSIRQGALSEAQTAGSRSEIAQSFTKAMRLLIQSGILALGACLAIFQEISAGSMIAASILAGRALAPIDAAVANWKNLIVSRQAYGRLHKTLGNEALHSVPLALPAPKGHLTATGVIKMADADRQGRRRAILNGVQFALRPGDGLGVIGASGSGKSSLAKLLIGLWRPDRGEIRLDGGTFDQWDRNVLGNHVGYLPQSVDLMAATIRQNIARFDPTVSDAQIVEAATLAGVHELILTLPDGYETDLAKGKSVLSGGQAQRVALARAVLRRPKLVVLDEPNASLDADGEAALINAISVLRRSGSCVVVMAHRPSAIAAVNKILFLKNGHQVQFGEKVQVLRKLTRAVPGRNIRLASQGNPR